MSLMNKYLVSVLMLIVLSMSLVPLTMTDGRNDVANQVLITEPRTPAKTYVDHDKITIDGTQDFIDQASAEGWPGLGTKESPIIISGYRIVTPGTNPIIILNTDCYFELLDNDFSTQQTWCGIWYENNSHAVIAGNVFHHSHSGMYIVNANDLLIENNIIHDTMACGIEIEEDMINGTIRNNIIFDTTESGIQIDEGHDTYVYNNTISRTSTHGIWMDVGSTTEIYNNTISNPIRAGIHLGDGCTGAYVYDNIIRVAYDGFDILGDDNHVYENVIYDSRRNGIKMDYVSATGEYASGNEIVNNSFLNSDEYSVAIEESCSGNTFTGNDFFVSNQTNHVSDNGADNMFSKNFYDTWIDPDADSDGYVDNPYALNGTAENQDALPLAEPGNPIPEGYEYVPIEMPTGTTSESISPMDIVPIAIIAAVGIVLVVGIFVVKRK
ncbi:MAG: right-handed parallel beta-helix repeat-containing protein [Candidatus Thorarchaeota archaeon]